MPYDKDGKYFRKPVFNENFKGLKNKKPSDTTSNKPKTPDEIKKERFKEEYEKMKNYKGSESYQKMMIKSKGSTSGYKKLEKDIEKGTITGLLILLFVVIVIFVPIGLILIPPFIGLILWIRDIWKK